MPNKENIAVLIETIQNAEIFNMLRFEDPCGSPSCICGWAICVLSEGESYDYADTTLALRWLGIDAHQAIKLFMPESEIDGKNGETIYPYARDASKQKQQAIDTLKYLAEFNVVDWPAAREHYKT